MLQRVFKLFKAPVAISYG